MKTLNLFSLLCLFALAATQLQAKQWRLALCYGENATPLDKHFRPTITNAVHSAILPIDNKANLDVKTTQCVHTPDLVCYADHTAIFCREEFIAQIVRTAAWLSAEATFIYQDNIASPKALQVVPKLTWVDAILLAHTERDEQDSAFVKNANRILKQRQLNTAEFDAIYSLVVDLYKYNNTNQVIDPTNTTLTLANQLYLQVLKYMFSYLVGHESFHLNKNTCQLKKLLKIEQNGFVQEAIDMQLSGGFYDPAKSLNPMEIQGDICGLRWLAQATKPTSNKELAILTTLSKKIAIDLLTVTSFAGYNPSLITAEDGQLKPLIKVIDGYFYPQSRLILATAVINQSEKRFPEVIKVCNDSAKAMVTMMQASFNNYPKSSGEISDRFLSYLPNGVKTAFNTGKWSAHSFTCALGVK